MKNFKNLSTIVLCMLLASMQISYADPIDTGLGNGLGGAVINNATSGLVGVDTSVPYAATLNFDSNTHVNWNTFNVNSNETMNFNAVNGATGLTVLNTVNQGMSTIYGQISANDGISKLIIANPNGMLFDGAKFTTAGDVMLTTKNMTGVDVNNIINGDYTMLKSSDWQDSSGNMDLIQVKIINNSDFTVGGEFNIYAPKVVAENSSIKVGDTLKLVTANGSDYLLLGMDKPGEYKGVTFLKAMNIDGNVEIINDVGALSISNGGTIDGNLNAEVGGVAYINGSDGSQVLNVSGNANIKGHGQELMFRNGDVKGNLDMYNDGGYVDIGNMNVTGNANLNTVGFHPVDHKKFNHYVHVIGDTNIGGDLNIESSQNVHIGNYEVTQSKPTWDGNLLTGNLNVGGNLNAHTTGGHIMTTINTQAKNINYNAESYNDGVRNYGGNVLTDDKAVLTADTYQFKSAGYIGGMKPTNGNTIDAQVIDLMENYTFIPADVESHEYMTLNGGTITKLETPKVSAMGNDVQVYIKSPNDLTVNGADASVINLVAPDKQITITGDVHAKEINVGDRTGTLKLDFPNRDFTTNYTSIKDKTVVTINPDEEITYELANKPGVGYNDPDFKATAGTNTTYLIGPGAPITPPEPPVTPSYTDNGENARNLMTQWTPQDAMQAPVNTPVAFAADLDEDEVYGPCRKNVDGSVTVVKAYPMAN